MIKEIITTILVGIASIFGISDNKIANLGAFSDPFLSVQLATGPSNDYCLKTDGTNNLWSSSCGTGGTGGSGAGWASTTADINSVYFTGDNIGKVGVGSSSPYALLSVTNTGTIPSLVVEDSTSPDTTPFIIDASGNVGIGTTTPMSVFTIEQAGDPIMTFSRNDSSVTTGESLGTIQFLSNDTSTDGKNIMARIQALAGVANGSGRDTDLVFSTANNYNPGGNNLSEKMRILANGYVGIGTTTPSSKLTVSVSSSGGSSSGALGDNFVLESGADNYINILTPLTSNSGMIFSDTTRAMGGVIYAHNGDYMKFFANGSEKMRIDSSGNVGIGTTSPYGKLAVTNTGTNPSFVVEDSTSPDTTPFIIDASGNVGIGTTSPTRQLTVSNASQTYLGLENTSTGGRRFDIGSETVGGAGRFVIFDGGAGGDYRMVINSTGNVGIGTTSPYGKLAVTNTGTDPSFLVEDSTSPDTTPFIIDASGNVGVGTAAPSEKLSLYGASGLSRSMTLSNDTTYYKLLETLNYSGSDSYNMGLGGDIFLQYDGPAGNRTTTLGVNHASGEVIINGNVGIGTTTPWAQLSVNPNGITGPSFVIGSSTATNFIVTNGGNVGVGLTAPLSKVHAKQAGSSVAAITAQTDNTAGRKFISYAYTDGGSEYGNVQIQSNTLRNEFSVQDYDIYHTGGDATLTWKSNSGQPYLLAGNGTASGFIGHLNTADGFVVGSITANNFVIRTNNTNRVTVNATTGNVGIGTTTPGQTLSVSGDILGNNLIGRTLTATSTTATSTIAGGLDLINSTVQQHVYPSFTYATSTSWTGTTTIPLGVSWGLETWSSVKCFTDAGTLNVSFSDGSNSMNMLNASTTVGTFGFTTNNQFTVSEKRFVNIGTPVSSPTTISCTIDKITNI